MADDYIKMLVEEEKAALKEMLESEEYSFVLVSGDYFDCPSCNDSTAFNAKTFYNEEELLKYILAGVGSERMEAIWLIDVYRTGHLVKYCDIRTKTGGHNVQELNFPLPQAGEVIVLKDAQGKWVVADKEYTILYGDNK